MIDIEKAEEEFKIYTSNYNMDESHIVRKVYHTFRVEELCGKIAMSLGLSEEEINVAKIIGLLHDIARFEQYTRYKTYDDFKNIDHGDFGVEILENSSYIRKYIKTEKYDHIILKAIKNHNKYAIGNDVNEREKVFCQIIRDADKLDIIYQATNQMWKDKIEDMEAQVISSKVLQQFLTKQVVDKKYIDYDIDRVVVVFAFIYDFNFNGSYKIIKENDYLDKIIDRFNFKKEETKKQMEEIRKLANEYIENKIKEE